MTIKALPTAASLPALCGSFGGQPLHLTAANACLSRRIHTANASQYVLVPWGPDPRGDEPQCLTQCFRSADTNCTGNGRIVEYGTTTEARTMVSEVCDELTGYSDPGEPIEVAPYSLASPPPPRAPSTDPSPPPLPPVAPPPPPPPPRLALTGASPHRRCFLRPACA